MDDFKSEDDLKKLDIQDLQFSRPRKAQSGIKQKSGGLGLSIPPQHLIIGTSILVLLMLVIGIGSMIKDPAGNALPSQSTVASLPDPSTRISENNTQPDTIHTHENSTQPQEILVPPVAQFPTEALFQSAPDDKLRRVELPGNIGNALSLQQKQVDAASQGVLNESATLSMQGPVPTGRIPPEKSSENKQRETGTMTSGIRTEGKSVHAGNENLLKNIPSSYFTLQLSSASRSDTLEAFARQQKLNNYQVYETRRNNKPWFVLISGHYASLKAAQKAIGALPSEVQAQKPWVKSVRQVHQQLLK